MKIITYGKINWNLSVVGKTTTEYHLLDTVIQSISLADQITFLPSNNLSVTVANMKEKLLPENNIAFKAAQLLINTFALNKGITIHIEKGIPVGAGMGGGSADAAATLVGLNQIWNMKLSLGELMDIGVSLGADVPFCIQGGLQHGQGIGEKLTPYSPLFSYHFVIIKPKESLSTKEVFSKFTFSTNQKKGFSNKKLIKGLQNQAFADIIANMNNDLEPISIQLLPIIATAITSLKNYGAEKALMTGSGSCVIGLFATKEKALKALNALRFYWEECYYATTLNAGMVILP